MTQQVDRFISIKDVSNRVGMCKAQIYKLISKGAFPKQVLLGARCARWSEREVQSWMESLMAQGAAS